MTRKKVNWKNFSSLLTKCACYIARRVFAFGQSDSKLSDQFNEKGRVCGYVGNTVFELFSKTGS